jgi:RimJ/RimL family protein N-acetyltransferase
VVATLDRPFAWSAPGPDIGQLDQFFVCQEFRGMGLAAKLLRRVTSDMAENNVAMVEAHVDADNEASLRAFLRAGWEGFRASGGDFYVRYRFDGVARR